MQTITQQPITVDYKITRQVKTVSFLQYDTNEIKFIVQDNGQVADLSNITQIVVNFKRPDGKIITQFLNKSGNEIVYRLTNSEMAKVGTSEMVLQLYDGDNDRVSIAKFNVNIQDNIEIGEEPTVEDVSLITQLIESVNERVAELNDYSNRLTTIENSIEQFAIKDDIPSYWKSHLETKIKRIQQLQDEDGLNRHSIGFITDMHIEGNNEKHSGKLIGEVDKECNLSFVLNGGDIVSHKNGMVSKNNALAQIREGFNTFPERIMQKMYYMTGNHDDNSHSGQNWANTFKEGEIYSQYYRHLDGKVVRGEKFSYYYKDDEFRKIRYIFLDSIDIPYVQNGNNPKYAGGSIHAFRQTQLNWFANVALNVADDSWTVLVCSHMPPYGANVAGYDRPTYNMEMARGILGAFKNKTIYRGSSLSSIASDFQASVSVDFTNRGGNVICWLTGHTHNDNIVTMPEGITLVTTVNDHLNRFSPAQQGVKGTITEQAFDILTIDQANKKVYLTRIGSGTDREFSYDVGSGGEQGGEQGALIFEDNFIRPNAPTLGENWITERGQFRIENNTAKPLLENEVTSLALYAIDVPQNNISAECTIRQNDGVGLVVRYQDGDNFIRAMMETEQIFLQLVLNDEKIMLASDSYYYNGDDTYDIRVELRGAEIKVYVNNVLELTGNSSNFLNTTKCGIRAWSAGNNNGTFYKFAVRELE